MGVEKGEHKVRRVWAFSSYVGKQVAKINVCVSTGKRNLFFPIKGGIITLLRWLGYIKRLIKYLKGGK